MISLTPSGRFMLNEHGEQFIEFSRTLDFWTLEAAKEFFESPMDTPGEVIRLEARGSYIYISDTNNLLCKVIGGSDSGSMEVAEYFARISHERAEIA